MARKRTDLWEVWASELVGAPVISQRVLSGSKV